MVYVALIGHVFEVDPHAPRRPARKWWGDRWLDHFLTNEEVLFNPDSTPLGGTARAVAQAVDTGGFRAA